MRVLRFTVREMNGDEVFSSANLIPGDIIRITTGTNESPVLTISVGKEVVVQMETPALDITDAAALAITQKYVTGITP